MRTLIVLRHAKSDWSGGEPDHDRPLAARGRRQAPVAGAWLADHFPAIDLAVVSTAARARETWSLAASALEVEPLLQLSEQVYAASGRALRQVVEGVDDEHVTVVLVGHNPGAEDLVHDLTGEWVALPTSAMAVIEWQDGSATLRGAGRPPY